MSLDKRAREWSEAISEGEQMLADMRRRAIRMRDGWLRRALLRRAAWLQSWINRGRCWRDDDLAE